MGLSQMPFCLPGPAGDLGIGQEPDHCGSVAEWCHPVVVQYQLWEDAVRKDVGFSRKCSCQSVWKKTIYISPSGHLGQQLLHEN